MSEIIHEIFNWKEKEPWVCEIENLKRKTLTSKGFKALAIGVGSLIIKYNI